LQGKESKENYIRQSFLASDRELWRISWWLLRLPCKTPVKWVKCLISLGKYDGAGSPAGIDVIEAIDEFLNEGKKEEADLRGGK
jgi:hypothetical protein